jgi:threonine dehydrogenase-like Zn-dependent dehydrogenase
MRATLMYAAGDVRVEEVPDSVVKLPTDALVRITASAVCGSDLWPYASLKPEDGPKRVGHEFIGVEETGSEVPTVKRGDLVVSPFAISDGTCEFRRAGLQTSCVHPQAGFWDDQPAEGAQAEAIRIPLADGTPGRTSLGRVFGATDVVSARGAEGIAAVRDLAGGHGTHVVIEAVGTIAAYLQAVGVARPGGVVSRVGVPAAYQDMADRKLLKVLIRP